MKLIDTEKREVFKLIEAGKPLPDKYRFLLFDDKREVELIWNGKTNEVTNIVLPFQVIEQVDEPRLDKKSEWDNTLFDMRGRQQSGWSNKLIWGDNKLILSSLKNGPIREDKDGIVTKEVLTKKWSDWIDYWSVDFDFENQREIVRMKNEVTGEIEEHWTGDFIFENEWQSFRTKKDRTLELKTPFHDCEPGRYKIAVKVVDIFGNDTMKIIDVNAGNR